MIEGIVCKHCQSGNVRKYGKYKGIQYYYCNVCKRKFMLNDFQFHMKTSATEVKEATDMFCAGMSITAIAHHLKREYGHKPSTATIHYWIGKYTPVGAGERDKQT